MQSPKAGRRCTIVAQSDRVHRGERFERQGLSTATRMAVVDLSKNAVNRRVRAVMLPQAG
jgi:hypothetical protein